MSFFRSILTLAAVVVAMGFPYFVGHGLALHETGPMVWGAGFLVLSAALVFLLVRGGREERWEGP